MNVHMLYPRTVHPCSECITVQALASSFLTKFKDAHLIRAFDVMYIDTND
jgi:hypothetical protein